MRYTWICLFVCLLCFFASSTFADTFLVTGNFTVQNLGDETINLSGAEFTLASSYGLYGSAASVTGGGVTVTDYQDPVDGIAQSSATFNGVSGVVFGGISFSMIPNPLLSNMPVAFSGAVTAYTCAPALPVGCLPGTELWSVYLSGTGNGDATEASPGGPIGTLNVGISGTAMLTPDPAPEPSTLLLTALALPLIFLQRPRCSPRR